MDTQKLSQTLQYDPLSLTPTYILFLRGLYLSLQMKPVFIAVDESIPWHYKYI